MIISKTKKKKKPFKVTEFSKLLVGKLLSILLFSILQKTIICPKKEKKF